MNEFIGELKQNGFRIFTSCDKEKISYFYFVKDDKIGYCQEEYFSGFDFSSVHKANRRTGTGYRIHSEVMNPTIKHCLDCFVSVPQWAIKKYWGRNTENRPTVEKYKDWEEYISSPVNQILKYREL